MSLQTNVDFEKGREKETNEKGMGVMRRKTYAEIVKGGIRECNATGAGTLVPSARESKGIVSFGSVNEIKRRKYKRDERLYVSH